MLLSAGTDGTVKLWKASEAVCVTDLIPEHD